MDDAPDYSRVLHLISQCHDSDKLMTFVVNAQRKNVTEVRNAALAQLLALLPVHKEGSFEAAFWDMLMTYQKILLEHGKPTKLLMKAWKDAIDEDEISALTRWVENAEQAWAFQYLIHQGALDMTAETLVLRFPKRFASDIRDKAKHRIKAIETQSLQIA